MGPGWGGAPLVVGPAASVLGRGGAVVKLKPEALEELARTLQGVVDEAEDIDFRISDFLGGYVARGELTFSSINFDVQMEVFAPVEALEGMGEGEEYLR
jgi:hypothetical protein